MDSRIYFLPIHPPVQGGNVCIVLYRNANSDTPSRVGRKQTFLWIMQTVSRYTLPYREETYQSGL